MVASGWYRLVAELAIGESDGRDVFPSIAFYAVLECDYSGFDGCSFGVGDCPGYVDSIAVLHLVPVNVDLRECICRIQRLIDEDETVR